MLLRNQFAVLLMIAAAAGAGWYWWAGGFGGPSGSAQSSEVPRRGPAATRVLVEPARAIQDKVTVRAIGTGEALRSAVIFPKVSGEVVAIKFDAQDRVKKGQVLLRLDDSHQKIAVRLAQVGVKEATRQLKRLQKLARSGTASQAQLETAETNLESAKLGVDAAKQALDDRIVYAPFDGVIGLTEIDEGDRVTSETVIATLDDRTSILVEFELPEEFASRIKISDPIAVTAWTSADQKIDGVISALGSRIDPTARTLRVKARIPNHDDRIRPGTSFAVELAFTGRTYPSVREVAVLWSRDGAYLWRAATDESDKAGPGSQTATAEKVFVKIVRRDHGRILVDGDIRADDPVVVEGVQGLRQGQRLNPSPYNKTAGKTADAPVSGTPARPAIDNK